MTSLATDGTINTNNADIIKQKIVSATEAVAESHHTLAQKIDVDVERPLREFSATNREVQAMSTISGNLAAMSREKKTLINVDFKLKRRQPSSQQYLRASCAFVPTIMPHATHMHLLSA